MKIDRRERAERETSSQERRNDMQVVRKREGRQSPGSENETWTNR